MVYAVHRVVPFLTCSPPQGSPIPNIARTYSHPPTTAWRWIRATITAIPEVFKSATRFPKPEELSGIARGFEERAGLRHCVGALDGCVVKCTLWGERTPAGLDEFYCARKDTYGILLHAMVDSTMRFRFWQTGLGASHGDSRALRLSTLWQRQQGGDPVIPPPYYVVGDSAYPMKSWLVRPLTEREARTRKHMVYNHAVSRTRIVVEQAFGKMKQQWAIVYSALSNKGPQLVCDALCAVVTLHNLTIDLDRDNVFTDDQLASLAQAAGTNHGVVGGDIHAGQEWHRATQVAEEAWQLHLRSHPAAEGHSEDPYTQGLLDRMARTGRQRAAALAMPSQGPHQGHEGEAT